MNTALRFAIADPPYLGRARRWYGVEGRGAGAGRHRADEHPDAGEWDDPERHRTLVADLMSSGYDGWAIAAAPMSLPIYYPVLPDGARTLIWRRRNAQPSAHRIRWSWEAVLVLTPPTRRKHGTGFAIDDVLDAPIERRGFVGAKPPAWTRWVVDAMGVDLEVDQVDDVFAGSGAVRAALRQGVLL